jgi:hypothetical protein
MSRNRNNNRVVAPGPKTPKNLRNEPNKIRKKLDKLTPTNIRPNEVMPLVKVWSDVMKDPFDFNPGDTGMPLNEDQFPCASVKGRNYAEKIIQATNGNDIAIYCFADATPTEGGQSDMAYYYTLFRDSSSGFPGCIYDSAHVLGPITETGIACGITEVPIGNPLNLTVLSDTLDPIRYDSVRVPLTIPVEIGGSSMTARTYAYGIRVSFANPLLDTEGWVEFVQARESISRATPSSTSFNTLRSTDPSYRRKLFGNKRTAEFVWHPNCDSIIQGAFKSGNTSAHHTINSRMVLRVGGLMNNEKILVEVMHWQEYTHNTLARVSNITPQTPHTVHVQNALVTMHGGMNERTELNGRLNKKTLTLHTEALAHKTMAHPALKKIMTLVEGAGGITTARALVPKLLKGLSGLVGDAELLAPLLAL